MIQEIENRRSIRKYKNKNVSHEQIEAIVKAAILAPSAKNRQPWKYIVYTGEEKSKLLDVMENALEKENKNHTLLPKSSFGTLHPPGPVHSQNPDPDDKT